MNNLNRRLFCLIFESFNVASAELPECSLVVSVWDFNGGIVRDDFIGRIVLSAKEPSGTLFISNMSSAVESALDFIFFFCPLTHHLLIRPLSLLFVRIHRLVPWYFTAGCLSTLAGAFFPIHRTLLTHDAHSPKHGVVGFNFEKNRSDPIRRGRVESLELHPERRSQFHSPMAHTSFQRRVRSGRY